MQLYSAGETPRERFNYRGRHRYVITLETHAGAAVFTARERVLNVLNALRETAMEHRFEVQAYCFLPARVLLLVQGKDDESYMKGFLSAFRAAANDRMVSGIGHVLWKKTYRERVLRKGEETKVLAREIWRTPVKEKLARAPEEYEFQGSFVKWLQPGPPPMRPRPTSYSKRPSSGQRPTSGNRGSSSNRSSSGRPSSSSDRTSSSSGRPSSSSGRTSSSSGRPLRPPAGPLRPPADLLRPARAVQGKSRPILPADPANLINSVKPPRPVRLFPLAGVYS